MRFPNIRWILVTAFCLLEVNAFAQYQLVLEKPSALKRQRIFVGDEIGIQVKGQDQLFYGDLLGVKATQIFMFGDSIDPLTFDRIRVSRPHGVASAIRGVLPLVGIVFPAMILLNTQKKDFTWKTAAKAAGIFVGAFALRPLLKVFFWRKIRLGKGKWRLRIMPTVEGLGP